MDSRLKIQSDLANEMFLTLRCRSWDGGHNPCHMRESTEEEKKAAGEWGCPERTSKSKFFFFLKTLAYASNQSQCRQGKILGLTLQMKHPAKSKQQRGGFGHRLVLKSAHSKRDNSGVPNIAGPYSM